MSKKAIEKYIPSVMNVLQEEFPDSAISSTYNGYISSFGASIMQSGLLPTLALYENTNASTKENKEYLSYLIVRILTGKKDDVSLLHYVLKENDPAMKQKILDISVAIKLSIRTFTLVEKEGSDE